MNEASLAILEPPEPIERERDLRLRTERYWELKKPSTERDRWQYYLVRSYQEESQNEQSLLQLEMDYAKDTGRLPSCLTDSQDKSTTLVILIGDSFEPLLQSIWVHQPNRLVPIVNEYYGKKGEAASSAEHWSKFYRLIKKKFPQEKRENIRNLEDIEQVKPTADSPRAVFEHLRDELAEDLRNQDVNVIVDITGAKKTMVAGAFMLAAYSRARIYYIDVEESRDGKPYGYKSRFVAVKSPLEELSLHVWQHVEQRYRRYDFAGALRSLEAIPTDEHICQFRLFLSVCNSYENGEFREAVAQVSGLRNNLQAEVPTAVLELGSLWPIPGETDLAVELFRQPDKLLVYANDALERAKRLLTQENNRAAFTLAYALHETLLKARIIALYDAKQLMSEQEGLSEEKKKTYGPPQPLNQVPDGLPWCLRQMMTADAQPILSGDKRGGRKIARSTYRLSWPIQDKPGCLPVHLQAAATKPLKEARNLITHTYFPATKTLANKAITLAEHNFEDYMSNWYSWLRPAQCAQKILKAYRFDIPSWEDLRRECELTFIPEQDVRGEQ